MTDDLNELSALWLHHKSEETNATTERRKVEDRMKSLIGIAENLEGTETEEADGFIIKIEGRIDRKIDSNKLQELALEAGLSDHLPNLFRWKPEINMSAWKSADASITNLLAGAITAKPGRSTFKITIKEEKNETV
jgi:primosomal replication protein N